MVPKIPLYWKTRAVSRARCSFIDKVSMSGMFSWELATFGDDEYTESSDSSITVTKLTIYVDHFLFSYFAQL